MYALGLRRSFLAYHYLIGGDWGRENAPNAHWYTLEVRLQGQQLDRHGYLVDLVHVEQVVEKVLARYREQLLNRLPEFQDQNPSLERFAYVLAQALWEELQGLALEGLVVRLWENPHAWAEVSYPPGRE